MSPIAVSSLFYNLQALLPPKRQCLLGVRWSFEFPHDDEPLTEYSIPTGYAHLLKMRSGITLSYGDDEAKLCRHLNDGGKAIVAVDSFDLPYRPAFNRVHSSRTVVVSRDQDDAMLIWDPWMPTYSGPIDPNDLTRARTSQVPLNPLLEPIFAGHRVGGLWFMIDDSTAFQKPLITVGELARDMCLAKNECDRMLIHLAGDLANLPDPAAVKRCRRTVLLLRSELSLRPYLCALLGIMLATEPALASYLVHLHDDIRKGAFARDLLTKSVGRRSGEWANDILDNLRAWLEGEARLASLLGEAFS